MDNQHTDETKDAFAKAKIPSQKTPPSSEKIAIGFYNVENLFDVVDDPQTLDDDFTPKGYKKWNSYRYKKKIKKLSKVITQIGAKETKTSPSLVGLAEVENNSVLQDLISTKVMTPHKYGFVHRDSPDERGIDVALLYKKEDFEVTSVASLELMIETSPGVRDRTRDILHVKGALKGKEVHLLVNHWPSRRTGEDDSEHKRISAAQRNRKTIDAIKIEDPEARIIIMGDFNDGPQDKSIRDHLVQTDFYNPMVYLGTRYAGSLNYQWEWYIYDQIIFSHNFMRLHENDLLYDTSDIFNDHFLTEFKGRFKGFPYRTYAGKKYLGGYSDHFPVYSILISKGR